MVNLEKKLAKEVLNKYWSDHPKEVSPETLINLTKQILLRNYETNIPLENLTIADCYKLIGKNGNLITTEREINVAEEIKNETIFSRDYLKANYETNILLLKKSYKKK